MGDQQQDQGDSNAKKEFHNSPESLVKAAKEKLDSDAQKKKVTKSDCQLFLSSDLTTRDRF